MAANSQSLVSYLGLANPSRAAHRRVVRIIREYIRWAGIVTLIVGSLLSCRRRVQPPVVTETSAPNTDMQASSPARANYVDDTTCAACHMEIASQFANHPMAMSLAQVSARRDIEKFGPSQRARFTSGPFQYGATETQDGRIIHSRQLLPLNDTVKVMEQHEVKYVVGSGQKGRSYLIDRNGRLFMSALTWYVEKGIWDLSPGYEVNDLGFDRVVLDDCLFCHANGAEIETDSKNRYRNPMFPRGHGIGCQRCHGPGDHHVLRHTADPSMATTEEDSIVNPGKLAPKLREAVCQQCHLAGVARVPLAVRNRYDFRPGMPLDSTIATFVLASSRQNETDTFVGQVEQMYASRCFEASGGKLGCISCHDPHSVPSAAERIDFYRARCLQCHDETRCTMGFEERKRARGGTDDCVGCHMPSINTEVRHASSTDHRIPRSSPSTTVAAVTRPTFPIAPMPPRSPNVDAIEAMRNLAVGMLQARPYHPQRIVEPQLEKLIRPLTQAVNRNPLDVDGREALGDLLLLLRRRDEGIRRYREVIAQHPNREHSVVKLATALSRNQHPEAIMMWERATRLNAQLPSYQHHLGITLAQNDRWREAHALAKKGVQTFPTALPLWHLLAESSQRLNELGEAELALQVLDRLLPAAAEDLRRRFHRVLAEEEAALEPADD